MLIQILDVDYFLNGTKPVIRIFGKREDGTSVCCLYENFLPYFYVEKNSSVWEKIDEMNLNYEEIEMFYPIGYQESPSKVLKITMSSPQDVPTARRALEPYGKCFDADILFKYRFMVDKGVRGMSWAEVDGKKIFTRTVKVPAYQITDIRPVEKTETSNLKFLCLDIECLSDMSREIDAKRDPMIMISLAFHPLQKNLDTLVLVAKPFSGEKVQSFSNEKEMLEAFIKIVQDYDPDVITGFNINGFDMPYILGRLEKYGLYANLSRCEKPATARPVASSQEISVTGRVVVDPYQILKRDPNLRFSRYNLNTIAKEILGEQKDDVVAGDMYRLWNGTKADIKKLVEYSRKDAILALMLVVDKRMLDKFIEISKISGTLLQDSLGGQTIRIETMALHELKSRKIMFPVKPDEREIIRREKDKIKGATVLEPKKGLHKNVLVLDFQSLYPSLIRKFNISPDTLLKADHKYENFHLAPTGAAFINQSVYEGVFPNILKNLLATRYAAKKKMKSVTGDEKRLLNAKQQALKIMANSFYGYLGYIRARLYVSENANAVTGYGRDNIQKTKTLIETNFDFEVVYGDTDSLFLRPKKEFTLDELKDLGSKISHFVSENVGLFFDFEKIYKSFIILTKKRYAGVRIDSNEIEMKGIETVRRDWCPLVTEIMLKVLETILRENDIEKASKTVKDTVKQLQSNAVEIDRLTIVKGITKGLNSYDGIQPHIEVAKKIGMRNPSERPKVGDRVGYVITRGKDLLSRRAEDPEHIKKNGMQIDSDYYINNQLIPPVDRIFSAVGIEKTELLGGGRQMNMFDMMKTGVLTCSSCSKTFRRMPMRGNCDCGGEIK